MGSGPAHVPGGPTDLWLSPLLSPLFRRVSLRDPANPPFFAPPRNALLLQTPISPQGSRGRGRRSCELQQTTTPLSSTCPETPADIACRAREHDCPAHAITRHSGPTCTAASTLPLPNTLTFADVATHSIWCTVGTLTPRRSPHLCPAQRLLVSSRCLPPPRLHPISTRRSHGSVCPPLFCRR